MDVDVQVEGSEGEEGRVVIRPKEQKNEIHPQRH
jgi:hypothetical protein